MIEYKEVKRSEVKTLERTTYVLSCFGWEYKDRSENSYLFQRDTSMPKYEDILRLEREYNGLNDKRINKPSVGLMVAGSIVLTVVLIIYFALMYPSVETSIHTQVFIALFSIIGGSMICGGVAIFVTTLIRNNRAKDDNENNHKKKEAILKLARQTIESSKQ